MSSIHCHWWCGLCCRHSAQQCWKHIKCTQIVQKVAEEPLFMKPQSAAVSSPALQGQRPVSCNCATGSFLLAVSVTVAFRSISTIVDFLHLFVKIGDLFRWNHDQPPPAPQQVPRRMHSSTLLSGSQREQRKSGKYRKCQICALVGARRIRVGGPESPFNGTGAKDFSAWDPSPAGCNFRRSCLSA